MGENVIRISVIRYSGIIVYAGGGNCFALYFEHLKMKGIIVSNDGCPVLKN